MREIEKAIEEAGLSMNEAKVYLALITLGSTTATDIIKQTGIHRANVYDTLGKLLEKGLVSSITKINIKHYQAASPERLLEIVNERAQKINKIIPELKEKFDSQKSKEEIRVFKGKKGLITITEDVLKENKTWFVFGAAGKLSEILDFYMDNWNKRRAKQKLHIKIIYDESARGKKEGLKFIEKKYLKSEFNFPTAIGIYGNKVVEFIFGEEPLITLIESEKASKGFLEFFNFLWKIAKR